MGIRFYHLAGFILDTDLTTIEMGNSEVQACQRLNQCDLLVQEKIGSLSYELLVLLFFNLNNDITCFNIWYFITFTADDLLFSIRRSFIDLHLEGFSLFLNLFATAGLAHFGWIHALAFTPALITGS